MLNSFSLKIPSNVYAGKDALANISKILEKEKAGSVALFTDKGIESTSMHECIISMIEENGGNVTIVDDIPPEPSYLVIESIQKKLSSVDVDLIIALGGGSVMDSAKLVSVLMNADYGIKDLLKNPSLAVKQLKTVMIPTTCGTGSEATCNAIVLVPEDEMKVGIVNDSMIPDYVILDSEMIRNLPQKIAASTGLDALCHAIECFTGTKANPFSDTFALCALKLIFTSIEKAVKDKNALKEKENMLIAAFYGGVAITSSGTTAVHALSYPLGGKYHIAHGVSNAMLLLPVMKFNSEACIDRFVEIYDYIYGSDGRSGKEKVDFILKRIEEIINALEIPTLSDFGIRKEDISSLAKAGLEVKRLMDNNPRPMSLDEAVEIYLEAL